MPGSQPPSAHGTRPLGRRPPVQEAVDVEPRRVHRTVRRHPLAQRQRLWRPLGASLLLLILMAAVLAWWLGFPPGSRPDDVIRAELQRHGLGAIAVSAQERQVHLAGELPPGVPAGLPVALAQAAHCSWMGWQRPCASRVTADLRAQRATLPADGSARDTRAPFVPSITPARPSP